MILWSPFTFLLKRGGKLVMMVQEENGGYLASILFRTDEVYA